jgi:hypothetical protein
LLVGIVWAYRERICILHSKRRTEEETTMKNKTKYVKPEVVKIGNVSSIKGNATGPSTDGRKYAGFFK